MQEKSSKTSREKMPPPTAAAAAAGGTTTEGGERRRGGSPAIRSKEPSEERETKRRKVEVSPIKCNQDAKDRFNNNNYKGRNMYIRVFQILVGHGIRVFLVQLSLLITGRPVNLR